MAARSHRFRVEESGLDAWIRGLDRMDEPDEHAETLWRQATDVMFDRSQSYVHVITGELKASGRVNMGRRTHELIGEVAYGGTPECDYAVYEFARGGSHDALLRAFQTTGQVFERTLGQILEDGVASWL